MTMEYPHQHHVFRMFNEGPVADIQESRDSLEYNTQRLRVLATERNSKWHQVFMNDEALHVLQGKLGDLDAASSRSKIERKRRICENVNHCPRCKTIGNEDEGICNDLLHDLHGCPYSKLSVDPKAEIKETLHVQEVRKPQCGTYWVHDPRDCPACQQKYHNIRHGQLYVGKMYVAPLPYQCRLCRYDYHKRQFQPHPQPQPQPQPHPQPQRLQVKQIPIHCENYENDGQHMYNHLYVHAQHNTCPYCDPNHTEKYPDYNREKHHARYHRKGNHDKRRLSYK